MRKFALYVLGGAALGFAYSHFIGCRSGTCPITSNPYIATLYGALVGYLFSGGLRRARLTGAKGMPERGTPG